MKDQRATKATTFNRPNTSIKGKNFNGNKLDKKSKTFNQVNLPKKPSVRVNQININPQAKFEWGR